MNKDQLKGLRRDFRSCVEAIRTARDEVPRTRRAIPNPAVPTTIRAILATPQEADVLLEAMVRLLARTSDDTWSSLGARAMLEQHLATAIFQGEERVEGTLAENCLDIALADLTSDVTAAPKRWSITAPVHALHAHHAGDSFAGVGFFVAPTSDARGPKHVPRAVTESAQLGAAHARSLGRDLTAVVDVLAHDPAAACSVGQDRVALAIDGLSIVGWLQRPGDLVWMLKDGPAPQPTLAGDCEDGGWTVCVMGRPDGFDVSFPEQADRGALGFDELDALLAQGPASPQRVRVQRATRLAGRSLRGATRDEVVFWAVAACEALAYGAAPSNSKHELALRIALMVAGDRVEAERVSATLLGLYQHRNAIAHGSHATIGEDEIESARQLVTRAVVAVAKHGPIAAMTKEEEAGPYFRRLSLSSLPEPAHVMAPA